MPTEREMGERRHAFERLGVLDYCWHWISGTESDPYGGRYCRQNKAHPVHGLPPDDGGCYCGDAACGSCRGVKRPLPSTEKPDDSKPPHDYVPCGPHMMEPLSHPPQAQPEETYHPTAVAVTLTRLIRKHLRHCLRTIKGVDCPDLLHIVDEWARKIAHEPAKAQPAETPTVHAEWCDKVSPCGCAGRQPEGEPKRVGGYTHEEILARYYECRHIPVLDLIDAAFGERA